MSSGLIPLPTLVVLVRLRQMGACFMNLRVISMPTLVLH